MSNIIFLGDIANIAEVKSDYKIQDDYVFNLEYVATNNVSSIKKDKVNLKGSKLDFYSLFGKNPLAVNLANNHCMDFGDVGFNDTITWLKEENIPYFGAGTQADNYNNPFIFVNEGVKCAILGYSFFNEHCDEFGVAYASLERIKNDINKARVQNAAHITVMLHWGREENPMYEYEQKVFAHEIIDYGADLIIGGHPHCIQPYEIYHNKFIFYSVGNCIFPNINVPSFYDIDNVPRRVYRKRQQKQNNISMAVNYNIQSGTVHVKKLCYDQNVLYCKGEMSNPKEYSKKTADFIMKLRKRVGLIYSNFFVDGKILDITPFRHEIQMKLHGQVNINPSNKKTIKVLFIGNISGQKFSYGFAGASIMACHELSWEFHTVANRSKSTPEQIKADEEKYGVKLIHADICRSPFSLGNMKAYKQIVKLIQEEEYDIIHCNTPVGGVIGRLAGKKYGVKKVIYQAHGFHFYKGAPIINWLLYYPIERLLAHITDAIITINQEDFERAQSFCLRKNGKVYYIPGVGIDLNAVKDKLARSNIRREDFKIPNQAIALVSIGELNHNKNHRVIIEALAKYKNDQVHCYIAGTGPEEEALRETADSKGISDNIHFLGYTSNVIELLQCSDIFVISSLREGLSRSLMEAMACGLPCIASKIRGNTDLIENGKGGFLCAPNDADGFAEAIKTLAEDQALQIKMGNFNKEAITPYDIEKVEQGMIKIYSEVLQ